MRSSLAYSYLCIVCSLVGLAGTALGQAAPQPAPAAPEPAPAAPEPGPAAPQPAPAVQDTAGPVADAPALPAEPRKAQNTPQAAQAAETNDAPSAAGPSQSADQVSPAPDGEVAGHDDSVQSAQQSQAAGGESAEADVEVAVDLPVPADLEARLEQGVEDTFGGTDSWTAPVPVLALHGYLRMRGELMDSFWLGRRSAADLAAASGVDEESLGPDPFTRFRPHERAADGAPCVAGGEGSVGGESSDASATRCDVDTLQFANLRLRLSPELNLTEDVRIKATFDILDNVVAGQAPRSFYGAGDSGTFSDSLEPIGGAGTSSIVARRAWAEVRNRDLGELRFGRMPMHWGLGMRYNAGNGLDQDFSSDMDRVLGIVKVSDFISDPSLGGIYVTASYDFVAEGIAYPHASATRPDLDFSQLDDVDQFTFSVARRLAPDEEQEALERGDLVFNGGLTFELRNQDARLLSGTSPTTDSTWQNVSFLRYTPDLWFQLKGPFGRIEAEIAYSFGSMRALDASSDDTRTEKTLSQLGAALESEFRFLDDKLALHFNTGFASGDPDVEGLSADSDFVKQLNTTDRISTYSFHPSYQVDMILWRNIMRQVSGAYYFKPGLSYDFVRSDFGELFGARLDVIWSRATSALQSPGNASNLGVELNAQIYWRSEDGAELTDGYHASLQYGVLFPMAGLGVPDGSPASLDVDLDFAQQLRVLLGVQF